MITYKEYRSERKAHPGVGANTLVRWLRDAAKRDEIELSDSGKAEIERDGFDLLISVLDDYDADRSHHGEFGEMPKDGAIEVKHLNGRYTATRDGWRYFYPNETIAEIVAGLRHYSKMGRHAAYVAAWEQVRADFRELGDNPKYCYVSVHVVASRAGVKLGEADVYGCEVETFSDRYVQELIGDLIPEAIEDARGSLKRLCETA